MPKDIKYKFDPENLSHTIVDNFDAQGTIVKNLFRDRERRMEKYLIDLGWTPPSKSLKTSDNTKLQVGDFIRLQSRYGLQDYTVVKFRQCFGIFLSDQHKEAGNFTPLCELYGHGPNSETGYIPNYGEYITNPVPSWMNVTKLKYIDD